MERFRYLFNRYVAKTATIAERLEFQEMLQSQGYDHELKSLIDSYFSEFVALEHEPSLGSSDEILRAVFTAKADTYGVKKTISIKLWPRIAVAASIALVVSIGGYLYYNNQHSKVQQASTYVADIAPGKLGATLTLANGKKIKLSDAAKGQLAHEAGVSISKTADGQVIYEVKALPGDDVENNLGAINTLTTAKGETYTITLPDKSKVWMNAASSLTYAAVLNEHGQRRVKLSGEAYFEISKDKAHPFVVETDKQEVEVLGTHFNINAYPDESIVKTTLVEGSVSVSTFISGTKSNSAKLSPNQQSILENGKLTKITVDPETATAWKDNLFIFHNTNLKTIMRQISRWYDIEVDINAMPDIEFYAEIPRNVKLSQVLNMLESTSKIKFKIVTEGGNIKERRIVIEK